ncbi:MAG: hypothetical protein KF824_08465 [Fimbriimonadaceae bacterium]|nr:MAG: hypothetical protein KF824_08465 [Fimbriimonadaceae bacterium]
METRVSNDHIAPAAIQSPLLVSLHAQQVARVNESPSSQKPSSERDPNQNFERGFMPLGESKEQYDARILQLQNSLDKIWAFKSTIGQLTDLLESVVTTLAQTPLGPVSNRSNQRLIRSASGAAKDIISHAEVNGEPLFNVNQHYLSGRPISAFAQSAISAYTQNTRMHDYRSNDPPLVRQAFGVVKSQIVGQNGVLLALQRLAEFGPHSSDRAKEAVNDEKLRLVSVDHVLDDAKARGVDPLLENPTQSTDRQTVDVSY